MPKLMDLRQLRYFVAIVDAGSLTRAAEVLHVAQPALSQQMAALEAELDARLLTRSVRGVRTTEAGAAVYRHVQTILKLTDETSNVAHGAGGSVAGRVRLGLPSSIAMVLAPTLLRALRTSHPGILVEIYESPSSYLPGQLLDERVDLSVLADRQPSPALAVQPLLSESLCFVRAGATRARGPASLADIAKVPLILTTRATTLRHLIDEAFANAGVAPVVVAEASSIQTLLTVVAQGELGTLIPYSALSWPALRAGLQQRKLAVALSRQVSLAWSKTAPLTAASECVRDQLVAVVRQLVGEGAWQGARLLVAERRSAA